MEIRDVRFDTQRESIEDQMSLLKPNRPDDVRGVRSILRLKLSVATTWILMLAPVRADESDRGYHTQVGVTAQTRIDWVWPVANQSPSTAPADWLPGYDSTEQTYELFVPKSYDPKQSYPLVLFVSPSAKAMGYANWQRVCEEQEIIFAGPHDAGNECDMRQRVRIVLDVLDAVRRQYNIDADRTYISGFSGGGRAACYIAFALPEYFGGVIPICAAAELREESWLRQRVIDRLSVAHLTGENDFNRGEVERFRGAMLGAVGMRSRVWVVPKLGHGVPDADRLLEAYRWLEEGTEQRRNLARDYPASRIAANEAPSRQQLAERLFDEGQSRIKNAKTRYSGLMQLKGITTRWPDLPQADQAKRILLEHEQAADRPWEEDDIAEQRLFLIARARGLDAYATGPLPQQYENQRADMARAAIKLWELVIDDGEDEKAVAEAKQQIPKLQEFVK